MSSLVLSLALWLVPECGEMNSPIQAILIHLEAVVASAGPHTP